MKSLRFVAVITKFNFKEFFQRFTLIFFAYILAFGLFEPGVTYALAESNNNSTTKFDYNIKPLAATQQPQTKLTVSDAAVSVEPKKDTTKVSEIIDKRTVNTKTYINKDGSKTLEYSALPLHYKKDGKWSDLGTTVTNSGSYNIQNSYSINSLIPTSNTLNNTPQSFDSKSGDIKAKIKPFNDGLDISYKNKSFTLYPLGANNVKPIKRIENSHETIVYTNAWKNVDVTYNQMPAFLKETIILKNNKAQNVFEYKISTGTKLYPHPSVDGALAIEGINPTEFFISPLSVNLNKQGIISNQVAKWSIENGRILLKLDNAWYKNLKTTDFPIAIDPSFYSDAGGEDGNFISYKSDGYVCRSYYCDPNVGSLISNGGKYNWRVMFRMPFDQLNGKKVLGAWLHLEKADRYYWTGYTGWYGVGVSWAPCFGYNCMHDASYQWGNGFNTNDWTDITKTVSWMSGGEGNTSPQWGGWMIMKGDENSNASYKQLDPWTFGMSVTYDTPTPITQPIEPANQQVTVDTQQTLKVAPVTDADGDKVQYFFRVSTSPSAESGAVINSGWIDSTQWTIPDGVLQDGTTYYWHTYTLGATQTNPDWIRSFKVDLRTGKDSTQSYDTVGPVGIDLATGNGNIDASSHTMNALGGSIGLNLSYNTPDKSKKGLTGEYWNLSAGYDFSKGVPKDILGNEIKPTRTLRDQNINFLWGTGSPSGINNDWFYSRWKGQFIAPKDGDYQFGGVFDDTLAVYINNDCVFSSGYNQSILTYNNAKTVTLKAGQAVSIRVESLEANYGASAQLYVKGAVQSQIVPRDWLSTNVTNEPTLYGLQGRYYTDDGTHDIDAAAKDSMRLMLARQDTSMNLNFANDGPAPGLQTDKFMARWTGYVTAPSSGKYTFGANSDDGVRIKTGTGLLGSSETQLDSWIYLPQNRWGKEIQLEANKPTLITIDWYEATGPAYFKLLLRGNGYEEQEVPVSWLTPKASAVPDNWQLGVDVDGNVSYERLRISNQSVILEDSSRSTHEYVWTGAGYKPPVNEDGILTKNLNNTYTFIDVDGRTYIFDTEGKLISLTSPTDDRQPAALKYVYEGDPSRLIRIEDGVTATRFGTLHYKNFHDDNMCGHPVGFDDAPSGMLCAFKTSDGDITRFYYKSGQLVRIEQPGNQLTDYAYDEFGRIIQIRDSMAADAVAAKIRDDNDQIVTKISYDAIGRVSKIIAPSATKDAPRLTHSLDYKVSSLAPLYRLYKPSGPTTHISSNSSSLQGTTESWKILYLNHSEVPGTRAIYSCRRSNGQYFAATNPTCFSESGNTTETKLGYLFTQPTGRATVPYSRLRAGDGYVLEYPAVSLAGWTTEEVLGYGYPVQADAGATEMHVVGTSEPQGFSKRVEYDELLRTTKETDVFGSSSIQEWDSVKDLKLSSTSAVGLKSTTIYDQLDRPTDNYGPAPKEWYGTDRKPLVDKVSSIPHTSSAYDEGISGLNINIYDNTKLFNAPKLVTTGMGNLPYGSYGLALTNDSVKPTDGLSMRAAGKMRLDKVGNYSFRVWHTDGARVFIDNQLVVSDWTNGQERFSPAVVYNNTVAGKYVDIRIEAYKLGTSGNGGVNQRVFAMLSRIEPGLTTWDDYVGNTLTPGYNLTTSVKSYDSQIGDIETKTVYKNPAYGTVEKTILDQAGLNYESKVEYESPGQGLLRQTSKTLPGGAKTTYQYYGKDEIADNPCTTTVEAFHQAGRIKSKTEPDPDGTGPLLGRKSEAVFNESGDLVATHYTGESWACTNYDVRGRVISTIIPSINGKVGRTVSNNYAVGGNPLIASTTDDNGTITVQNDLIGRTVRYVDAKGNVTNNVYDAYGKLASRTSPIGKEEYVYDKYDRLVNQKLDGIIFATITYDGVGRIGKVNYPAGITLSSVTRDTLGRENSDTYTLSNGQTLTDTINRYVSGDIIGGTENGISKSYTYDKAGRLTGAKIGDNSYTYSFGAQNSSCTVFPGYDAGKDGNRTSMTVNGKITTYCYDAADRLVKSSDPTLTTPVYDNHGNIISIGDATHKTEFGYDTSDRDNYIKSGNKSTSFVRDVQGRIISRIHKEGTVVESNVNYGFTGSSDTPDFLTDSSGKVVQKYLVLPGDVLVTIKPGIASAGATTYSLPNIHGDIFAIINADGALISTFSTGPFGEVLPVQPKVTTTAVSPMLNPSNTAAGTTYQYVGQNEKMTDLETSPISGGIIQMGARPYIPILGRFISVDPVEGGTDNNYAYANDPVNEFDLSGSIVDTIVDIASIGYDGYEMVTKPSWGNAGLLAWSVGAAFIPFVPGSYAGRIGSTGFKAAKAAVPEMARKAVQTAAKKVPVAAKIVAKAKNKIADVKEWAHTSRVFGIQSKLFGNDRFGSSGILNRSTNVIKIGWSHVGTRQTGYATFRIGWTWNKKSVHIDLFKPGIKWWW